jgi:hypothetical protein
MLLKLSISNLLDHLLYEQFVNLWIRI